MPLWRGTPLVGLRDERFADDARRHLEEQRLAVLEDRIDDDLAAGRHAELVPELEELVRENPLRESLQGQLMRALYGAGRQADALEAYRQARKTLSQELGLEPARNSRSWSERSSRRIPSSRLAMLCGAAPRPSSARPRRRLAMSRARRRRAPRREQCSGRVRLGREQHSDRRDAKLTCGHRHRSESTR